METPNTTIETTPKKKPSSQIISFTGDTFSITIPSTSKSLTFSKVETTRGDIDNRWQYPSPIPAMSDSFKDKSERIIKYQEILGTERLIEIIEDSLQQVSQNTWRSIATPPEDKDIEFDNSLESLIKEFTQAFIEGKTREGITSMGFAKKMNTCRAEAMKLMKKNQGKKTPEVIALMQEARKWHEKYLEQMNKEMLEMEES